MHHNISDFVQSSFFNLRPFKRTELLTQVVGAWPYVNAALPRSRAELGTHALGVVHCLQDGEVQSLQ